LGEVSTVLVSTTPGRQDAKLAGEVVLEPWEALVSRPSAA
jgi:hypothetical protein